MKTIIAKSVGAAALSMALTAVFLLPAGADTTTPSTTANSTPGGPPSGFHGKHEHSPLWGLVRGLNLTDAQMSEIAPILKAQEPQVKAIEQQAHTQIAAIMTNVKSQILPYLTAEQQQALAQREAQHAQHAGQQ
jgi:Spy/CpxP family protein refolding chaperone